MCPRPGSQVEGPDPGGIAEGVRALMQQRVPLFAPGGREDSMRGLMKYRQSAQVRVTEHNPDRVVAELKPVVIDQTA